MQFCSTRQFISRSQRLVPLQLPAAVLPADAAQPLTSTFTKVMAPASASTWLPSLEVQDRLNNRAPAARPGTPTVQSPHPAAACKHRLFGAPMQQADAGGALQLVPVVFRDSLPMPCGGGGDGANKQTHATRAFEAPLR